MIKKNIDNSSGKGFTLIELLIVIAIIGILASIILVSINSSRIKSQGAAMKASIASIVPAVTLCCVNLTNNLNNNASPGSEICNPAINSLLPTAPAGITFDNTTAGTGGGSTGLSCSGSRPGINIVVSGASFAPCNKTYTITANGVYNATDNAPGFPTGC